jgi:hypothetical protein
MPISQIVTNSIANNAVTAAKLASDAFSAQIFKPSITSPANNATEILDTQLFTATTYLSLYGRSQANANWQISTSPTFAFINVDSTITGSNTQFQANASSGLVANTIHYARVRYSDDANNSSDYSNTVQFTTNTAFPFIVNFLVVAGGGGAGGTIGSAPYASAGGGAGGYRSSVPGFSSGANSPAESATPAFVSTNYTVTVGAGGAISTRGSNSVFGSVSSRGGGAGSPASGGTDIDGGSGGGGGDPVGTGGMAAGTGVSGQGTSGGSAPGSQGTSGGGGGAGAAGSGNQGGNGLDSPITGTSVTRGGGGSGLSGSTAPGGSGGGGASGVPGGPAGPATAGTPNTGGGGGGARGPSSGEQAGKTGGSGTVILRYPNTRTISNPGGGLTFTTSANGSNTVAIFTAGTGSVSWS